MGTYILKMARGFKKHLKRLNAPKHWMLDKLSGVFAPRPTPGPHKLRECLPLCIFLRNRLHYALTYDEVKRITMQRLVKVDGKVRTDPTYQLVSWMSLPLKRLVNTSVSSMMSRDVTRFTESLKQRLPELSGTQTLTSKSMTLLWSILPVAKSLNLSSLSLVRFAWLLEEVTWVVYEHSCTVTNTQDHSTS